MDPIPVTIRQATEHDLPAVRLAFADWGYRGNARATDTILMAEHDSELVGLVRLTPEHGVVVLRGLSIPPKYQMRGVGRALMQRALASFEGIDFYCLPLAPLKDFFAYGGFVACPADAAPPFLADRLEQYRHGGGNFILMRRPGA
ncbi:hypothetical protein BWI17_21315 [Betaproteobacteria bacterium GR16-43]|nr:hypothetical protein BWI17_21315 [Betaproteobacteria bacterium GR16-43]